MTTSVFKALLVTGLVGALLALLPACGDGDGTGKLTLKAPSPIVLQVTPYPTLAVPEGPLPTREADFATTCQKSDQKQWEETPSMVIDPSLSYTAVIRTEKGDITLELLPDVAPITVNNFVFLACKGFYDGLTFHRVIDTPRPLVQAGDPTGEGAGGPGYNIPAEISDLSFLRGTVGMASRGLGTPINGSQFFICLEDSPDLDGQFVAFARVVEGLEVADGLVQGDGILEITIQEE